MKYTIPIILILILLFLSGCSPEFSINQFSFIKSTKEQTILDTTKESVLNQLKPIYSDVIINSLATEECEPNSFFVIGYLATIKSFKNSGSPEPINALICMDFDGNLNITWKN